MTCATARGVRRSSLAGRQKGAKRQTGSWCTKRWTPARRRDLDALDHPNFDLMERLDALLKATRDRLRYHLIVHPNDIAAQTALARAQA